MNPLRGMTGQEHHLEERMTLTHLYTHILQVTKRSQIQFLDGMDMDELSPYICDPCLPCSKQTGCQSRVLPPLPWCNKVFPSAVGSKITSQLQYREFASQVEWS